MVQMEEIIQHFPFPKEKNKTKVKVKMFTSHFYSK